MEDVELLYAWQAGDANAGETLFARHFESVRRFFQNKVTSDHQDLIQQTFLGCLESRERIGRTASFRAYLFGVARHVLYAWIRGRGRAPADFSSSSAQDLAPSVTTLLRGTEEQRLLLEALRRLPLDVQVALELYYWEQLPGPELAAALGEPEGTVRTRIRRGKRLLRERLEEIAASGETLSSTLSNLETWAAALRQVVLEG